MAIGLAQLPVESLELRVLRTHLQTPQIELLILLYTQHNERQQACRQHTQANQAPTQPRGAVVELLLVGRHNFGQDARYFEHAQAVVVELRVLH